MYKHLRSFAWLAYATLTVHLFVRVRIVDDRMALKSLGLHTFGAYLNPVLLSGTFW